MMQINAAQYESMSPEYKVYVKHTLCAIDGCVLRRRCSALFITLNITVSIISDSLSLSFSFILF